MTERKKSNESIKNMNKSVRKIKNTVHILTKTKSESKLIPVVLPLNGGDDISASSIIYKRPESELSNCIYEKLIHLNIRNDPSLITIETSKEKVDLDKHKEKYIKQENLGSIKGKANSKNNESMKKKAAGLKSLLKQKYEEFRLQSYTFTTDNEIKSVPTLSIIPSKSINLSENSVTDSQNNIDNCNASMSNKQINEGKENIVIQRIEMKYCLI